MNISDIIDNIDFFFKKINDDIDIKNRIPDFSDKTDNDLKILKIKMKYKFIFYILLSCCIIALYFYFENRGKEISEINIIYLVSFFCICVFGLVLYQITSMDFQNNRFYLLMFLFGIICVIFYYFYETKDLTIKIPFTPILIFVFFIVIIALAIFYRIFLIYLKKQQGIVGIIINLIFFIPCIFNDILEYFKNQYNITTNTTFLLLLIEFIILFFYFYFYNNLSSKNDRTCIMKDPVYLNKQHVIADNNVSAMSSYVPEYFNLKLNENKFDFSIIKQKNFYSVSFWLYMNQNNGRSGNYNIFKFSENITYKDSGRPTITYNSDKHLYKINCSNTTDNSIITASNVPNQRWNFFVIVYHETKVYLYINGNLENFIDINHSLPISQNNENIIIGENDGLNGAICNVHFHNKSLKTNDIANIYNLLRLNNPPI